MQIVKQSVARDIPCLLIKSVDGQTPETGALAGSVTITYHKEGASTWSSKTASGNWTEVTPGKGAYLISWSTDDLDTVGRFDVVVEHASCVNFYGSYEISVNLLDDIAAAIAALNDPTVAALAEAVHDIKVTFDKTTGGLVITMADDTPLTSVTITDTTGEVTRE